MPREFNIEADKSTFRFSRLTRERIHALTVDTGDTATDILEQAIDVMWREHFEGDLVVPVSRDVYAELDELKALMRHMNRRLSMVVVAEGEVYPIERAADFPADRYGIDWIVVGASDDADALAQAAQYDAGAHPAQNEMRLFAAMVQSGAATL